MSRDRMPGTICDRPLAVRCASLRLGPAADWDAAIVIPAKDEERRLPASLNAVGAAIRAAKDVKVGIVVVVNNTRDSTALRAFEWAADQSDVPFVLIDCAFSRAGAGVGAARRLGLDLACRYLTAQGALLTTDADTAVRADWVVRNLAELQRADLICGTVLGLPDEACALPAAIASHGSAEWEYLQASLALVARLDPQSHDPAPAHHNAAGASMAVSRRVYRAVGGLPVLRTGEDRALAERIAAHDFRVCYSADAIVETSCRMTGRAEGGMAAALRARACESDPHVDEWLEAPATLALRHGLRGRLRAVWPDQPALHAALIADLGRARADRIMKRSPGPHFGAFFATVEQLAPRLARHRLRFSDCRRDLPQLLALLARTETATQGDLPAAPRTHRKAARDEPAY